MANTGIQVPDEVLENFDREIARRQGTGELPTDMSRSRVIQMLMEEFVEGNSTSTNSISAG